MTDEENRFQQVIIENCILSGGQPRAVEDCEALQAQHRVSAPQLPNKECQGRYTYLIATVLETLTIINLHVYQSC